MASVVIEALTPIKLTIAQRCRLARVRAGLTQAETARRLGWHRPTVSELESGRRSLRAEECVALARQYGVMPSWLLGEGAP